MRRINRICDVMLYCATALFSMLFFIVVLISVLSRYILQSPILASIELSRLFFVWSCFLAAAITYRDKAHIGFTLLFDKSPPRIRTILSLFIHTSILVFAALVFYHSIVVNCLLWRTDLPMLAISQSWFYVPLPLVCLFIISFTLEFLADELSAARRRESS
jgi:TRAP-type C4-dicarboxylate transport system permease small subunit